MPNQFTLGPRFLSSPNLHKKHKYTHKVCCLINGCVAIQKEKSKKKEFFFTHSFFGMSNGTVCYTFCLIILERLRKQTLVSSLIWVGKPAGFSIHCVSHTIDTSCNARQVFLQTVFFFYCNSNCGWLFTRWTHSDSRSPTFLEMALPLPVNKCNFGF